MDPFHPPQEEDLPVPPAGEDGDQGPQEAPPPITPKPVDEQAKDSAEDTRTTDALWHVRCNIKAAKTFDDPTIFISDGAVFWYSPNAPMALGQVGVQSKHGHKNVGQ